MEIQNTTQRVTHQLKLDRPTFVEFPIQLLFGQVVHWVRDRTDNPDCGGSDPELFFFW